MKLSLLDCLMGGTFVLLISVFANIAHADVYIIANAPGISLGDLRDIYLGDKQFSGTVKLDPVNNSAAQDEFMAKVLKMDTVKYNAAWTKKSFREGLNPLPIKASDLEVIDYVKRTPGAIGYVTSEPKGMTALSKF